LPIVLPIHSGMEELYNANSAHRYLKCYENERLQVPGGLALMD
jgi:hypothetical protein